MTALLAIPLSWVPYAGLSIYWNHLISTVPGASHGEVSGPISFFLPVLFVMATIVSFGFLVIIALKIKREY
ncbi:MAG: hypothetical protein L3J01_04155 [Thiomicrorhabdus sp.]|nr:hypothetical protein [Thiomicrorhabdus sp.]